MIYYDLTGKKIGNLLVIKRLGQTSCRDTTWETLCDCGRKHVSRGRTLRNGTSISCGCRMSYRKTPIQRFLGYIKKSDACWEWIGPLMEVGYGSFRANNITHYAHRFSYEYHFEKIPKGKLVCHKCDNRKCVNPDHLFLGSHSDNTNDMLMKNRHQKGVDRKNHKLNPDVVREIRKMRKIGKIYKKIAKSFGVSYSIVRRICLRKMWKHVI